MAKKEEEGAMVPAEQGGMIPAQKAAAMAPVERYQNPIDAVKERVKQVKQLYQEVLQEKVHYGAVPGTGGKPTLLKPGAELIVTMFGLTQDVSTEKEWLPGGHLNIDAKVLLYKDGRLLAAGEGSCSSMESKYRYRNGPMTVIGPVPQPYWATKDKSLLHGGKLKKMDDGKWMVVKYGERVENENIADTYNTVKKMAVKRALVAAALMLGASAVFTQDMEDVNDNNKAFDGDDGKTIDGESREEKAPQKQKPSKGSDSSAVKEIRFKKNKDDKIDLGLFDSYSKIGFGAHKGKMIRECPGSYLDWLRRSCTEPDRMEPYVHRALKRDLDKGMEVKGLGESELKEYLAEHFGGQEWDKLTIPDKLKVLKAVEETGESR